LEPILRDKDIGVTVSKCGQDLNGYYCIIKASYDRTLHANAELSLQKQNRPAGTPPLFKVLVLKVHINLSHKTLHPAHKHISCDLCPSSLVLNEPQN
jgi:hypothetical protein